MPLHYHRKLIILRCLCFFSNYFEGDFNRNLFVKSYGSLVRTNFFHGILHEDNLSVNLVTQLLQLFSNLNASHRTEDVPVELTLVAIFNDTPSN